VISVDSEFPVLRTKPRCGVLSGPAMLSAAELEYTGVTERLEGLDKRFKLR